MDARDQGSPIEAVITIRAYNFAPDNLIVRSGTKVNWINRDPFPHTVVSDPDGTAFESPNLNPEEIFSHTFEIAGEYPYYCSIHPGSKGKIVVVKGAREPR